MTLQAPICLVTSDNELGRARALVLRTLLASRVWVWPYTGVEIGDLPHYSAIGEFWIDDDIGSSIILKFAEKKVFRPHAEDATDCWTWFLHRTSERAVLRLFGRRVPLTATLASSREGAVAPCGFKMRFLRRGFHDLRLLDSEVRCRRAASWLARIDQELLLPFQWFQHESSWEAWNRAAPGSELKRELTRVFSAMATAAGVPEWSGQKPDQFAGEAQALQSAPALSLWSALCTTMMDLAEQADVEMFLGYLREPLHAWSRR